MEKRTGTCELTRPQQKRTRRTEDDKKKKGEETEEGSVPFYQYLEFALCEGAREENKTNKKKKKKKTRKRL